MICPVCGNQTIERGEKIICSHFPVCSFQKAMNELKISDAIVFDIETTGTNNQKGRIIEIGAIKLRNGVVVDEFDVLTNPGKDEFGNQIFITLKINELTGISNDMVEHAISEKEGLEKFIEFCGDIKTVIGQNIISFDIPFVKAAARRNGLKFQMNEAYDTLRIARSVIPSNKIKDYKQTTLADYYHFSYNAHRALDDVKACYRIFEELQKEAKKHGVGIRAQEL